MNNIVAAILLIGLTVAGAATLYHYRDAIKTSSNQPLSLEKIGPYNATYDVVYIASGCLDNVLAFNSSTSTFQHVERACAGSLVLFPRSSSSPSTP